MTAQRRLGYSQVFGQKGLGYKGFDASNKLFSERFADLPPQRIRAFRWNLHCFNRFYSENVKVLLKYGFDSGTECKPGGFL